MLLNPNKYVRETYLILLANIGVPVYDKRLPTDIAIPPVYVLIQSQTKVEINRSKCDKMWKSETNLDLYSRSNRGFSESAILDDLEDQITAIIAPGVNTDITFNNFITYNTFVMQPMDAPMDTPEETILHRILRFQHILGEP